MTTAPSPEKLPPLPESAATAEDYAFGHDLYNADQMHAYALEALAASEPGEALTFDHFRAANVARCLKWHPAGIASWSPSDWLTAVTGELGELASLLKMRNRERDELPGNKFSPTDKMVADELADVLTYLDLLAEVLGVNLGQAAVEKFNEVSERVGFPDRIQTHPPVAAQVSEVVGDLIEADQAYDVALENVKFATEMGKGDAIDTARFCLTAATERRAAALQSALRNRHGE
jgi:NTP pyrophosphatase (non-canonical NTP hydrolase)